MFMAQRIIEMALIPFSGAAPAWADLPLKISRFITKPLNPEGVKFSAPA